MRKRRVSDKRTLAGRKQVFLRCDIKFYRSMVSCHSVEYLLASIGRVCSLYRDEQFRGVLRMHFPLGLNFLFCHKLVVSCLVFQGTS